MDVRKAWWVVLVGCSSKSQDVSKASAPLEHPSPSAVVALARSTVKPAAPIPRPGSDAKWIDTRALAPRFEIQVPERSSRPLRIASGGFAIAVVPEVLDRPVAKVDGASLFTDVAPATDLVYVSFEDSVEEFRVLHTASAPTTFRWRIQRDGVTLRLREGFVEALDDEGRARLRMAPIVAVDAHGVQRAATVELRGDLLEARLDTGDLTFPVVLDPAWGNTATMGVTRSYLSAVVLSTGKVMAIGGQTTPSSIHKSAEIYDPATNTWTLTASMSAQRSGLASTTLPSGKVLATGGGDAGNGTFCTSTAELYDPATDSWSSAGSFPGGNRGRHAQVLLKTGKVFAAGGATDCRSSTAQANAAVYDPATNAWTATTGTWATGTRNAAIGVLPDGKVMVAHGSPGLGTTTATHLYDPTTNAVSAGPSAPGVGRDVHAYTSLADGRLLIAGGIQFAGSWSGLSTTEVYDGPGAAFIRRAS